MEENDDDKFMRRCLDLASCAQGMTYPNPMVGSVVVSEGEIIGEGYHQKAGLPHAEVNAINSVKDKSRLKRSTLYVNLEPCSHFGKTPPCADFIVQNMIPRVVIGTADTSSKVSGTGISRLKSAGCDVTAGVLEHDSRWINRRFFTFNEKKRPWIILKWAESADGFLDIIRRKNPDARPNWISGKPERALVHRWRSFEQAILVGARTFLSDSPRLNVREWYGSDPLRLILSSSGSIMRGKPAGRFIIFSHNPAAIFPECLTIILKEGIPSCQQISEYLFSAGLQSLFVEGGSEVLTHFISNNLWDEARIFTGKEYFSAGVRAPVLKGKLISDSAFAGSRLRVYTNDGVSDI